MAHDAKGQSASAVGDVLPLQQQEGQTKHMISVQVSDQNGAQIRGGAARTPEGNQSCWRCINEVLTVQERH